MYISIEQALEIYDELILAKEGKGYYKGNQTNIYAFRYMPKGKVEKTVTPSGDIHYDNKINEHKAAEDLHTLCKLFEEKYNVKIFIENNLADTWIDLIRKEVLSFNTRVQIKMQKNEHENN